MLQAPVYEYGIIPPETDPKTSVSRERAIRASVWLPRREMKSKCHLASAPNISPGGDRCPTKEASPGLRGINACTELPESLASNGRISFEGRPSLLVMYIRALSNIETAGESSHGWMTHWTSSQRSQRWSQSTGRRLGKGQIAAVFVTACSARLQINTSSPAHGPRLASLQLALFN